MPPILFSILVSRRLAAHSNDLQSTGSPFDSDMGYMKKYKHRNTIPLYKLELVSLKKFEPSNTDYNVFIRQGLSPKEVEIHNNAIESVVPVIIKEKRHSRHQACVALDYEMGDKLKKAGLYDEVMRVALDCTKHDNK